MRHYSVGLTQNLDIVQDVAALTIYEEVCQHYLKKAGIDDMFISVATHQWMQAFPHNEAEAFSIIIMVLSSLYLGVLLKSLQRHLTKPSASRPKKPMPQACVRPGKLSV